MMKKISRVLMLILAINLVAIFFFSEELKNSGLSDQTMFIIELCLFIAFIIVESLLWISKQKK